MPDRFSMRQPISRPPATVSLKESLFGPPSWEERSQILGSSLQDALVSSTPSLSMPSETPEVPLPYSMQPEAEGAPTLRGPGFDSPGMDVGADMGAYGGRRHGGERSGGVGRKLAPVLELLGSLGVGAQAGSRERGGGLGGFLSGMGAGYSATERSDLAREQMEADRENQKIQSVVQLLKAQSDQARAQADAQFKGIQGQKLARETELMDPELQIKQEEQITRRLAAESQASLNEVRAKHEAIKAELAPVYAQIRERLGNAQAEKLLNDAALAELEKQYMPQRYEGELENLAARSQASRAQAQSSRANAGYMGAMAEAVPQQADARQLGAYAAYENSQKQPNGTGRIEAILSRMLADETTARQRVWADYADAIAVDEATPAERDAAVREIEGRYLDLRTRLFGGADQSAGGGDTPSREPVRPGRRGSAPPSGDPLGILGGP